MCCIWQQSLVLTLIIWYMYLIEGQQIRWYLVIAITIIKLFDLFNSCIYVDEKRAVVAGGNGGAKGEDKSLWSKEYDWSNRIIIISWKDIVGSWTLTSQFRVSWPVKFWTFCYSNNNNETSSTARIYKTSHYKTPTAHPLRSHVRKNTSAVCADTRERKVQQGQPWECSLATLAE